MLSVMICVVKPERFTVSWSFLVSLCVLFAIALLGLGTYTDIPSGIKMIIDYTEYQVRRFYQSEGNRAADRGKGLITY